MTDTNTDEAIRMLLRETGHSTTKQLESRKKLPPLVEPEVQARTGGAQDNSAQTRGWFSKLGLRPRHFVLIALVVAVILRPWLVLWGSLLFFAVAIIMYFSLGPEFWTNKITRLYMWLLRKSPASAEKIRLAARRTSRRMEVMLEKLPARWTSGLYLPDFDPPSQNDPFDNRPDPFERLQQVANDVEKTA
jgi:hypothetical protein